MLMCHVCGRARDATIADLMTFIRLGWPKCCGEVMTLFVETERPGGDSTPLEGPALPPIPEVPPG
jgi:hypothetical protein